jgi:hypothetical protein
VVGVLATVVGGTGVDEGAGAVVAVGGATVAVGAGAGVTVA